MYLTVILLLLLFGILLIVAEIVIIPGFGFAGVGGILLSVIGLVCAFSEYGATYGITIMILAVALSALLIYIFSHSGLSQKLRLTTRVEANVSTQDVSNIAIGTPATAATRMNLYGKIRIDGRLYEAKSLRFVDVGTDVEVIGFEGKTIIVNSKSIN